MEQSDEQPQRLPSHEGLVTLHGWSAPQTPQSGCIGYMTSMAGDLDYSSLGGLGFLLKSGEDSET